MDSFRILFVCLGNICRSPLAEGVMSHLVSESGLSEVIEVDSCGTGAYHVGEAPHEGSIAVANKYGVAIEHQRARQLTKNDFERFNLLVALDQENRRTIIGRRGAYETSVVCLREYDAEANGDLDVPDPYYLPRDSFETVYSIILRSCQNLLDQIRQEHLD